MELPEDLTAREATAADLPAIAALRRAVGWDVHEWGLRAALEGPRTRFLVVTGRDGDLVAVGSGVAYGVLGFIGNMIVAEAYRRRGIGTFMVETIVTHLAGLGCRRFELLATPSGRPLYERCGFERMEPGAMAHVPRGAVSSDAQSEIRLADREWGGRLAEYDAPRFGGDRGWLLARMAGDPHRPLLVALRRGEVAGYVWVRPERERVGPFLADDPSVAADLVADAFARLPAATTLTTNLSLANRPGAAWLRSIGAELEPWDRRMGRGPLAPRRDETIYGNAIGALG